MLYIKKVEEQTMQIVELLAPALKKRRGRYKTAWGIKTTQQPPAKAGGLVLRTVSPDTG
jgi:hypothetical protein